MSINKKLKVRVHIASFVDDPMSKQHFFINVRNCCKRRQITIVDVFYPDIFTNSIIHLHADGRRPLPATILPGQEWETWVPLSAIVGEKDERKRFIVETAGGHFVTSSKRKGVPKSGNVPGGD